MPLNHRVRTAGAALLAAAVALPQAPAAANATVELRSGGGYQSLALASDVTEVELVEQTQGACRFNRTWGYDLTNRELWVNGVCGGRFKLVKAEAVSAADYRAAIVHQRPALKRAFTTVFKRFNFHFARCRCSKCF